MCFKYISLFLFALQFSLFVAHASIISAFFNFVGVEQNQLLNTAMIEEYPEFVVSLKAMQVFDGLIAVVLVLMFAVIITNK